MGTRKLKRNGKPRLQRTAAATVAGHTEAMCGNQRRSAAVRAAQERKRSSEQAQRERLRKAGDGVVARRQERSSAELRERQKPVIMASVTKVAKRIPLIKFPNRKAGDAHASKAGVFLSCFISQCDCRLSQRFLFVFDEL